MKIRFTRITFGAVLILMSVLGCSAPPAPPATTPAAPIVATPVTPAPVGAPAAGAGYSGAYGIGRPDNPEDITAWDIDISPDGVGLPPGSGAPADGAKVFAARCAKCHGDKGQGGLAATSEVLVGTQSWFQLGNPKSVAHMTIGNYWPYATTVFDYVRRAMPFDAPESLTDDEVYRVVAWLLNQNKIIGDNDVMNAQTMPKVRMPNRDGFVPDPRPWPEVQ